MGLPWLRPGSWLQRPAKVGHVRYGLQDGQYLQVVLPAVPHLICSPSLPRVSPQPQPSGCLSPPLLECRSVSSASGFLAAWHLTQALRILAWTWPRSSQISALAHILDPALTWTWHTSRQISEALAALPSRLHATVPLMPHFRGPRSIRCLT